jgi:hypothetical protein
MAISAASLKPGDFLPPTGFCPDALVQSAKSATVITPVKAPLSRIRLVMLMVFSCRVGGARSLRVSQSESPRR